MPDPLAMPHILINSSPTIISSYATFGFVSVVMIADAIFNQYTLFCSGLSFSTRSESLSLILSTGNSSPMTPVEANIKSFTLTVSLVPFLDFDFYRQYSR